MTANHIDTLNEWYENAERITRDNIPNDGDTIIYPQPSGAYTIEPATFGWDESIVQADETVRILARAPKPKPAWHDAVAVIAHTDDGYIRQVWERDGDTGYWCGTEGYLVRTEKLRDVTPLIEAKVTDEMHDRVRDYYRTKHRAEIPRDAAWLNDLLTVALGLEAE